MFESNSAGFRKTTYHKQSRVPRKKVASLAFFTEFAKEWSANHPFRQESKVSLIEDLLEHKKSKSKSLYH